MKTNPALNETTLGRYFVDERGEVWQHITFCERPTASLRRVNDDAIRVGGAVGAPIFDGYVMLEPEKAG